MDDRITVAAVGDIYLGGRVGATIERKGPDYIFEDIRSLLLGSDGGQGHDIVVGNLESPISDIAAQRRQPHRLVAKSIALDGLKRAGFNAVALANNHIMDYGAPALQDTLQELEKRQIGWAGAGPNEVDARRPLRQVGGKNVTLLSYYGLGKGGNISQSASSRLTSGALGENPGHNSGDISRIVKDIEAAREKGDMVLVFLHGTVAAVTLPLRHQAEHARRMIDHGAAAVLTSGPHVLQPVERYNGGVIAHSLGNFVFDLEHRPNQKQSMILHLTFVNGQIQDIKITPIQIDKEHRPTVLDPNTDPELYRSIGSLLVDRLDEYTSDAHILRGIKLRDLTPGKVLKKLIWREHGVYPLSTYIHGLKALIRGR